MKFWHRKNNIKWTWRLRLKTLERRIDSLESMTSINNDLCNVILDQLKKKGIIKEAE